MKKPLLIYDGDCSFCHHWVGRWKRLTDDRVDYVPYQELPPNPLPFSKAVHFIDLEGQVSSGAEAVFHLLVYAGLPSGLWAYRHLPGFAAISNYVYSIVAGHRPAFYFLTRWIWRATGEPK